MPRPEAPDPPATLRHAVALCAVAGYVDAFGYFDLAARVFAANMTGNTVFLGTGLATGLAAGDWDRAATNAAAIGVFFAGAVAASLLRRASGRSYLCLLLAAGLLVPVRLAPLTVKEQLFLLALAMGAQGASIRKFGAARLQTVVVTGTLLRLADGIVTEGWKVLSPPSGAGGGGTGLLTLGSWAAYGGGAALGISVGRAIAVPLIPPISLLLLAAADLAVLHGRRQASR